MDTGEPLNRSTIQRGPIQTDGRLQRILFYHDARVISSSSFFPIHFFLFDKSLDSSLRLMRHLICHFLFSSSFHRWGIERRQKKEKKRKR
jgi:hypothetical protein